MHFDIRHGDKVDSTIILTALGMDLEGNKNEPRVVKEGAAMNPEPALRGGSTRGGFCAAQMPSLNPIGSWHELLLCHVPKVHEFPQSFVAVRLNKLICLVMLKRKLPPKAQIRAINAYQSREQSLDPV